MRLALLTALVVVLAGCDNAIETPDTLRGTYTLWGALDPTQDVQSLRVSPVTETIGTGTAEPLPLTVASVDLATGAETPWRDSVVTYPGFRGGVGHIFRAPFRPAYTSRHRVIVRTDAGREISAVVAVPPVVRPIVQPTRFPAGRVVVPVIWPGAPQLNRVTVTYRFCTGDPITRRFVGPSEPVEFGWLTSLDLSEAAASLTNRDGSRRALSQIVLRAEVASEGWRPPGGVFDFETLAEPTAFSNVDGGFGFVGSAYVAEIAFRPSPADIAAAQFGGFCNQ